MMTLEERQRGSVYKSLETDQEFCNRVRATRAEWYAGDHYYKGQDLDDEVWFAFKMQRKLVERFA